MWAATRGFIASCRSGFPGCRGGVWAATHGFIASCRSVCSMTRLVGHGRPRIESCLSEWNNVKLRCFWCLHGAASAVVRPLRVNSPGRVPAPSPLSPLPVLWLRACQDANWGCESRRLVRRSVVACGFQVASAFAHIKLHCTASMSARARMV